MRPLIFLCHSNKDKVFVRTLARRLKGDGVDVWLDEVEIKIGHSIHERISEGLRRSDFLAIVLSKASVQSRWVKEDLNSAASMEKLERRGVFILPLRIEECEIPPLILDRRYANFEEDYEAAYQELLESVFFHFKDRHPEVALPAISPVIVDDALIETIASDPRKLITLSPRAFEEVVARTFTKLGYVTKLEAVSRDGGADVVAEMDLPALREPLKVIVECKRYSPNRSVDVGVVRQLMGAANVFKADRAIVVTTGRFTKAARAEARRGNIALIDAPGLAGLLQGVVPTGGGIL